MGAESGPDFEQIAAAEERAKKTMSEVNEVEEQGLQKIKEELPKSPQEKAYIMLADTAVRSKMQELGLPDELPLEIDRVHFLAHQDFLNRVKDKKTSAVYNSRLNGILVDVSRDKDVNMVGNLCHEMVHMRSLRMIELNKNGLLAGYGKTGYGVTNFRDRHEHFRGLTEAVTQMIVNDIGKENIELINELSVTRKDITPKDFRGYDSDVAVVEAIIERVTSAKGLDKEEYRKKVQKGLFTGEMMWLRDVDEVYGAGSIRVLAAMQSIENTEIPAEVSSFAVLKYFTAKDPKERERHLKFILNERERTRLKNFQQRMQKGEGQSEN